MSTYINILNGKKNTNRLDYSKKNQALQLQCQLNKPKGLKIKRSTHETNGCRYSTVQCQHFGCTVPKYCSGIAAFYIAQQVLAHLFLFHKLLGSWPAINSLHELGTYFLCYMGWTSRPINRSMLSPPRTYSWKQTINSYKVHSKKISLRYL